MRIARATAALVMVATLAASAIEAGGQDRWRSLPARSRQQYELGLVGGSGEQHMHAIARSRSEPWVIYLSHDCAQIWRSEDNGVTWLKPSCEGMLVHAGESIEVDPVRANVVLCMVDASYNYIAEPFEGLYRSTDYGESWDLVLPIQSERQRTYKRCIAYDLASVTPDGAQRWYLGVVNTALYVSDDGGLTWAAGASLAGHSNVYSVYGHINDGSTVYVATSRGLYRSTDRGRTLAPLGDLPAGPVSCLALHPTDAETLYAVVQGVGLYRSTNGGAAFTRLAGVDATGVFINRGHPEMLYLSCLDSAVKVSRDGGATWSAPRVVPPPGFEDTWKRSMDGPMTGISPDPRDGDAAVAYSHASLYRTEDGGASFVDSSGLFTGWNAGWWPESFQFDVADPDRFYIFCADIGMCYTENGGLWFQRGGVPRSWIDNGTINWGGQHAGALYPETGSDLLVSMVGRYWTTKLIRSTDGGENFTLVNDEYRRNLFIAFNTDNPAIVYADNKRSTDMGQTFAVIPYLNTHDAEIVGMCPARPDTIYAMNDDRRRLFRSDDAGVSWRLYAEPGWRFNGMDKKPTFDVDPVDPDMIYTIDAAGDLARFDGTTWTSLAVRTLGGDPPHKQYVHCVQVDPRHPEILYAGLFAAGYPQIFRSLDAGATWTDITFNLPRIGGPNFAVHPLTGDLFSSNCAGTRVLGPPYDSPDSIYPNCPLVPPHADAGADVTVTDADGDGMELVWLDGSASRRTDAPLVDFYWTENEAVVAAGQTSVAWLPVGLHTLTLTVFDDQGALDTDVVCVEVAERPSTPGDADGDGDVDLADFVILKNHFGAAGASWAEGDFNGDGDVDLADFVILKNHLGS